MKIKEVKKIFDNVSFLKLIKANLKRSTYGKAVIELNYNNDLTQIAGFLHGGVLATISDAAGAFALYPLIDNDKDLLTISLNINYLSPVRNGKIFASAEIIKKGNKIATAIIKIEDKNKNIFSFAIANYRILTKASS